MRSSLASLLRQPYASLEDAAITVPAPYNPVTAFQDVTVDPDDAEVLLDEGAEPFMAAEENLNQISEARVEAGQIVATLEGYCVSIESLLKSGSCTAGTAMLIEQGVQNELGKLGLSLKRASLESCDNDVVAYHQATLEGIMDVIHRLTQTFIMYYNHHFDFVLELVRSSRKSLKVAKERLDDATENLDDKGLQSSKMVTGSLVELWYHFTTDKGQPDNILSAIRHDLELSTAALVTYPKALLDLAGKVEGILRGAKVNDEAGLKALVSKIQALPHPADLFPKTFIGGMPFLSVTGVEINEGRKFAPITLGGVTYDKLAQLASTRTVQEHSSLGFKAGKAAMYVTRNFIPGAPSTIANVGAIALPKTVELTIGNLREAIALGHKYIANVESSTNALEQWHQSAQKLVSVIQGLINSVSAPTADTNQILYQVAHYCENIAEGYAKIVSQEQQRSFKGAKYVGYLCKRMSKYA